MLFMFHTFSSALQGQTIDQMIIFGPSETAVSLNFSLIDDNIALEPPESHEWVLTLVTLTDAITIQPFNRTNIEIKDSDGKRLLATYL